MIPVTKNDISVCMLQLENGGKSEKEMLLTFSAPTDLPNYLLGLCVSAQNHSVYAIYIVFPSSLQATYTFNHVNITFQSGGREQGTIIIIIIKQCPQDVDSK
jgi:hypothetical protein